MARGRQMKRISGFEQSRAIDNKNHSSSNFTTQQLRNKEGWREAEKEKWKEKTRQSKGQAEGLPFERVREREFKLDFEQRNNEIK